MTGTSTEPTWRERYDLCEALLNDSHRWVANGAVLPHWIGRTERFWYERQAQGRRQLRVVDAATGQACCVLALDTVAQALAATLGAPVPPEVLILQGLRCFA